MSITANLAVGADPTAANPRVAADLGLAVADVCWPFFEHLIREIDRDSVEVLRLKCMDYLNGWRISQYPWSPAGRLRRTRPGAWDQQFVLPSGWMKRFPRLGMRPIARSFGAWWDGLSPRRRGLLMTYPHYLHLRDQVRPDVSIYYNFDDYALFWPLQADRVRAMERAMVRAADLTFCVSRLRTEELREAVPEADFRIQHLPHGTPNAFLAPEPLARPAEPPVDIAHLPRPLLGYIGSMEDRVDWELMDRLSLAFPEASIVVVGRSRPAVDAPWWEVSARFLARPNVHAIGWRRRSRSPAITRRSTCH